MSNFVLVHGSWHGAWCWRDLTPRLEALGHRVVTLDLPGHGEDQSPPQAVTLQSYADRVGAALGEFSEPAVLVGHSMGGIAISQAAEQFPEKIASLVYLCAFLLQNGQPLVQVALADQASSLIPNLMPDEAGAVMRLKDGNLADVFYADCAPETAEWALAQLRPDPIAPVGTPIQITDANYGRIPRYYIECLQDRAVSPSVQKVMYTAMPCRRVISMQTSHSPFLSAPGELAGHLAEIDRESR
ncbi:MAG: alpha/beta fold hydrolase [Chloroflexi bacterium]|nr:alpha/beta fold hydrolase [Chloroflexota bacterium]